LASSNIRILKGLKKVLKSFWSKNCSLKTFLVLRLQFFKSLRPSKVKTKTVLAKTKTSKKWP